MNNYRFIVFCIALLAVFVAACGCVSMDTQNDQHLKSDVVESPANLIPTYAYEVESIGEYESYYGVVEVMYVPSTDCMCHVYSGYYKGGISCIPCSQLPDGVCPTNTT